MASATSLSPVRLAKPGSTRGPPQNLTGSPDGSPGTVIQTLPPVPVPALPVLPLPPEPAGPKALPPPAPVSASNVRARAGADEPAGGDPAITTPDDGSRTRGVGRWGPEAGLAVSTAAAGSAVVAAEMTVGALAAGAADASGRGLLDNSACVGCERVCNGTDGGGGRSCCCWTCFSPSSPRCCCCCGSSCCCGCCR